MRTASRRGAHNAADRGIYADHNGSVAQSVEQGPLKPKVVGSIPTRPTTQPSVPNTTILVSLSYESVPFMGTGSLCFVAPLPTCCPNCRRFGEHANGGVPLDTATEMPDDGLANGVLMPQTTNAPSSRHAAPAPEPTACVPAPRFRDLLLLVDAQVPFAPPARTFADAVDGPSATLVARLQPSTRQPQR